MISHKHFGSHQTELYPHHFTPLAKSRDKPFNYKLQKKIRKNQPSNRLL